MPDFFFFYDLVYQTFLISLTTNYSWNVPVIFNISLEGLKLSIPEKAW